MESLYVGAQNDCLFIIDKPPRPSNDDINPDQDVKVIAKVYPDLGNDDAYARLFAAAPDLLKACQEAESWLRTRVGSGAVESCLPSLCAAIAKATGDQ